MNVSICCWRNLEITDEVNRICTNCVCTVYRFYTPVLHVNVEGRQAVMKYSYNCLEFICKVCCIVMGLIWV